MEKSSSAPVGGEEEAPAVGGSGRAAVMEIVRVRQKEKKWGMGVECQVRESCLIVLFF